MKEKIEVYEGWEGSFWRIRERFMKDKREVYERYGRKFMKDKREVYEG